MIIISSILVLIKIFGNSSTDTVVVFSVAGFIMAFLVMIIGVLVGIKEDIGVLKEFKNQTINKISEIEDKIKMKKIK